MHALRAQMLTGRLEAGARLPSTRVLAGALGVSRNTTTLAYEQLLLEGYVESRVGDAREETRHRSGGRRDYMVPAAARSVGAYG